MLSLPPAFVLSQDQTLKLNEKLLISDLMVTVLSQALTHEERTLDEFPSTASTLSRDQVVTFGLSKT